MVEKKCEGCGKKFETRLRTSRFCSNPCRYKWLHNHIRGSNHWKWVGGPRWKKCQFCEVRFTLKPKQPITTFKKQKFCSKKCADKGGFRYLGETHPNYKVDSLKRARGRHHVRWANAVLERDGATCQECGASGIEMHAHHIKSYWEHPDLRFDVSNGTTLCFYCHWKAHAALNAKAVNSGNTLPCDDEGNPEPSLQRNLLEGVTTRGKAFRKWVGECKWCGKRLIKCYSDVKNNQNVFCSYSCNSKHMRSVLGPIRGKASTKAAPERDEIV